MRSWQRSAMAFTVRPPVSATRSRNTSVGEAAYGSERTPSAVKVRSATRALPHHALAALAQAGEEGADPLPRLRAPVEPLPVQPHQADQLVADVDRHEVGT